MLGHFRAFRIISAFALLSIHAVHASGSGLSKPVLIGAKAVGMAGAFVAIADDPTAIFHNPAGLCQLNDKQVQVGADILLTSLDYTYPGAATESADHEILPVPRLFCAAPLSTTTRVGLGVYFPHGNGGSFDHPSANPLNPRKGRIYSLEIAPAAAWQVSSTLSVGGSLRVVRISSGLNDQFDPVSGVTLDDLELHGWGVGVAAGALFRAGPWSGGMNLRSKVDAKLNGHAALSTSGLSLGTHSATLDQTLPSCVTAGAAFSWSRLVLATQVDYEWNSQVTPYTLAVNGVGSFNSMAEWADSRALHFGGRYQIRPDVCILAGYAKDLDVSIPDGAMNRILGDIAAHEVSVGASYNRGRFSYDVAWNGRFGVRDIDLSPVAPAPGHYAALVQLLCVQVGSRY